MIRRVVLPDLLNNEVSSSDDSPPGAARSLVEASPAGAGIGRSIGCPRTQKAIDASVDIGDFDLAWTSSRGCRLQTVSLITTARWTCSCPMQPDLGAGQAAQILRVLVLFVLVRIHLPSIRLVDVVDFPFHVPEHLLLERGQSTIHGDRCLI